jgi:quercetin dioxygenase-like cupin family protein
MLKHRYVISSLFISLLVLAGCQKFEGDSGDVNQVGLPEVAQPWGEVGAHRLQELNWQKGEGTLGGIEVAVVGQDAETGATAMYLKIPPKAPAANSLHVHPSNAHAIVLEGSVSINIDGKEIVGKKGDYFFIPANIDHDDTKTDPIGGALVFMITEGKFDTIPVSDQSKAPAPDLTTWGNAQLHSPGQLQWQNGEGAFAGVRVAVVGRNRKTGGSAMFLRVDKNVADARLHHHTSSSHTIVLEGSISQVDADGKKVTMSAGDYFRGAAFDDHQDSVADNGALVFMISDSEFGTEYSN